MLLGYFLCLGSPPRVRRDVRRIVLHRHRYFQEFCRHVAVETYRTLDHISHLASDMRGRLHWVAINSCDTDSR
jgi:hypothetical protein